MNVLVWYENKPLPEAVEAEKRIYPNGIHGALGELFSAQPDIAPPVPAPDARIWRVISSVLKSLRRSPTPSTESIPPSPFRQAARYASSSIPQRSTTIRSCFSPARSLRRSKTRCNIPDRSRSTLFARAERLRLQNKFKIGGHSCVFSYFL